MKPGYFPIGSVLQGTDDNGVAHCMECVEADPERHCRGCFFYDYPHVCERMLCAPGKRPDKTAASFKEIQDPNPEDMRYRITGYRVWDGDREVGSETLGRSPYMTRAELTAKEAEIREAYAREMAKRLSVDFSLKAEKKGRDDEEVDG